MSKRKQLFSDERERKTLQKRESRMETELNDFVSNTVCAAGNKIDKGLPLIMKSPNLSEKWDLDKASPSQRTKTPQTPKTRKSRVSKIV